MEVLEVKRDAALYIAAEFLVGLNDLILATETDT
jgi:hypothetical protein